MLMFALGFVAGAVVVGLLAHRKPEWFAKVVSAVNAVDDKINKK
jgi:hypothetical protein